LAFGHFHRSLLAKASPSPPRLTTPGRSSERIDDRFAADVTRPLEDGPWHW
jgi:hypothetical protein